MSYTPQSMTLALLPKFTGFLSLIGSAFIFQDIVLHKNFYRVYHRLVLGLSCADIVASIVNILSTWPIPADSGAYLASGTTQTCTAQGFFNELGNLCTPLYNLSLCAYYVLVICNGWTENEIKARAEPIMHIVPTATAFLIAILGIPFTLYNNSGWLCWIATYPSGCHKDGTCTRGEHANIFRWVHYAIIWSAILSVTAGMTSIYIKARNQEKQQAGGNAPRGSKSKNVVIQAGLFVGALYLTWFFTTITRIYGVIMGKNNFVLLLLMAIFFPLQGFFNCLVYLRPRYLRCRSRNPDASVRQIMMLSLFHESHPIHRKGATSEAPKHNAPPAEIKMQEKPQRSLTASFYSIGNSKVQADNSASAEQLAAMEENNKIEDAVHE